MSGMIFGGALMIVSGVIVGALIIADAIKHLGNQVKVK